VKGWPKKNNDAPDPNLGIPRCEIDKDAHFDRNEHIVCMDSAGVVRKEKLPRHTTWSKFDDTDVELQDVSRVKRAGVPRIQSERNKLEFCPEPSENESKRWVGWDNEPPSAEHGSSAELYQGPDSMAEIEKIIAERPAKDKRKGG
jgi:hypothetical protein